MESKILKFFTLFGALVFGFLLGLLVNKVMAWTDPGANPPSGGGGAVQTDASNNVTIPTGNLTLTSGNLIVSGGKVGINQSSPAVPLHVSGNIQVGDSTAPKGINIFDTQGGHAQYCIVVTSSVLTLISGACSL